MKEKFKIILLLVLMPWIIIFSTDRKEATMHSCPRCGMSCDCSGDWDDIEVMKEDWVFQNCECTCEQFQDDDDFEDGDTLIGYQCLCCQHTQDFPGECERCCAHALDPMFF